MQLNINVETNNLIENSDFSNYEMQQEDKVHVLYTYIVDEPAVTDLELVAEYPTTGGKDYKEVVVTPEKGHFAVAYPDGSPFPYQIDVPEGVSKDSPVPDIIDVIYWKELTAEEASQKEAQIIEAQEKAEARETFLDNAPERVDSLESTQDDIVLFLADMVGGAS